MIEMIINVPSGTWNVHDEDGRRVSRDESQAQPGNYFIASEFKIELVDEDALLRAFSGNPSGEQVSTFTNAVRRRDRGCVITKEAQGDLMVQAGIWSGFDAAHIFPLAYSARWVGQGFGTNITTPGLNGDNINSVQNGILLRTDLHQLFDNYHFSISTKDDYKIICFMPDNKRIAGTHLSRKFLSDPQRPPDALFDWHFRQAVLSNMKAGGQPAFEHDYPPGSDMVGQIINGPEPERRMEFELFTRLANFQSRR